MNINQQQNILKCIEQINVLDIEKLLIERYPGESDFEKVIINKYSAHMLFFLLRKMITQLKNELENGIGLLLPNRENFNNDWGQITVDSEIETIYSYIQTKQFDALEPLLDKFIFYQVRNGFWDRSEIKAHSIENEKINKQLVLIELNIKANENNLKLYDELIKKTNSNIEEINALIQEFKIEQTKLLALANNANANVTEIGTLLSAASNKETEINGILTNIKDKVSVVVENISEYQTGFEKIQKDAASQSTTLFDNILKSVQNLEHAKKGVEFIEGKKSEIIRLTGMAADGSLGSKFDQRQKQLNEGLTFWKWGVPVMTLVSFIWVGIVFAWLRAKFDTEWINLIVNLLKTSPAFILLGFVFTQYSKERNLQEEYAFKSAVAMTLTAYSNMLEMRDEENNKSRQEMLLKSIQQVYTQPHIHTDKRDKFSFNGKQLAESIKTLSEAVKNIKN